MGRPEFVPPVQAVDDGWVLNFDAEERNMLVRLMSELREILVGPDDNPLLGRLFPTAYPDDEEKEAEYQRLMRDELVTSRLAAIDLVTTMLGPQGPDLLDEGQISAFMQSVNSIRLVLGAMLDITDDNVEVDVDIDLDEQANDETGDETGAATDTPEQHLYEFLSWVLEWTVRARSAT